MSAEPPVSIYKQLESRIASWAAGRSDLRAGVVVGSRARPDGTADEWSDLDLIFFTTEPAAYTGGSAWLESFGELWAAYLDSTSSGYPEWFALYAGGFKVDIVIVPVSHGGTASLVEMLAGFAFQDVIQRGVRVLFDKTGNRAEFPTLSGPEALPPLPSNEQFQAAIHRFWIKAAKAGKLISRGDLWRAKQVCDCELKEYLLEMLEWHARTAYNPGGDTWHEGRFIGDWADPRSLVALPLTFAGYDQADLRRALLATLDLHSWLAYETAAALHLPYPTPAEEAIHTWFLGMFA